MFQKEENVELYEKRIYEAAPGARSAEGHQVPDDQASAAVSPGIRGIACPHPDEPPPGPRRRWLGADERGPNGESNSRSFGDRLRRVYRVARVVELVMRLSLLFLGESAGICSAAPPEEPPHWGAWRESMNPVSMPTRVPSLHACPEELLVIPEWDAAGVIPPIAPGASGASPHRAPYRATMIEVVERYGRSPERRAILRGLLELRRALREVGLAEGFQWLDGSFVEDVETLRGRAPADIDVVTFAHLGDEAEQQRRFAQHGHLFLPQETKARFSVDGYYSSLDEPMSDDSVRVVTY